MKKVLILLLSVSLFSCSNKQEKVAEKETTKVETFADKAKGYLYTAIDRKFPHDYQNQPQISEREVLIANDSVFVEQFKMRYQNEYGGITNGEMTYVFVKSGLGLQYALEDYSENHNKKFIMSMAEVYNRSPKGKYKQNWDVGDPDLSYSTACLYTEAWGESVK